MKKRDIFTVATVIALSTAFFSCKSLPIIVMDRKVEDKRIVAPSNDVVKEHAGEINRLYGKLNIRSLEEIPEEKDIEYNKYVNNGTAYVLVHPSYYVFFHNYGDKKVVVERPDWDFSKNIVDIFIDDYPAGGSKMIRRMKESAKKERDFLRKASARERLVVLVLPPDYLNHPEYPYRKLDEFARYINEVTNYSSSVIFVSSESYKRGTLTFVDMTRLNRFFRNAGVKSLMIGGGYVDLCLKDFLEQATNLKEIEISTVSDICVDSPDLMEDEKLK